MKLRVTLFFLLAIVTLAAAQDKHFTQFYAAPLTLNPALTGAFEGRYRVGTIYRDQWRRVLDNPIRTFALSADLRFDAPGSKTNNDAIGLGLMFFSDRVSVVDFSTTQIAISAAYHKSLDADNSQFLTVGVQGGLAQRNLNYESLNFHDEFNGVDGYTLGSGEDLPGNNFSYGDWNVGLNYTVRMSRGALFAGAALHHFSQPQVSFYENSGTGDRLYTKVSGQLAADLPLGKDNRVALQPRALFSLQGPHLEINAGTNLRFAMGEYGSTALHVGSWVRPVRNNDGIGVDAVVALLGLEYNNVLLGLSYDLNLRALQYNQRQGAFEISIAYLGNYENEDILCPKF